MASMEDYVAAIRAMTAEMDEPVTEEDLLALADVTVEYLS